MSEGNGAGPDKIVFYVDGGCIGGNPGRAVYWSVARKDTDEAKTKFFQERKENHDYCTNNEAEWLALLACLKILEKAKRFHGKLIEIISDSQLIVKQFNGINKRSPKFVPFYDEAHTIVNRLELVDTDIQVTWKPRRYTKAVLGH